VLIRGIFIVRKLGGWEVGELKQQNLFFSLRSLWLCVRLILGCGMGFKQQCNLFFLCEFIFFSVYSVVQIFSL